MAFADREFRRQVDLARQHFVSQVQLDDRRHALDVARQQLAVLQQDIERVLAGLNQQPDAAVDQYPAYQEVAAEHSQASINLEHTTVFAPFDGVVSNVPKPGQHLNAGSPALALVASSAPWIEANFNETDLTYVLPGQTAAIRIDMYPDLRLTGKVASISPASGAEFSILPAQNASGNWEYSEIDWNEFKQVLAGNGPCNRDRLAARRKAHEEGAWVRDAAAAYAEKRRQRSTLQAAE